MFDLDPRARHLRRLRGARRAARRWTILAGGSLGTAAVLLPYQDLGLPDAGWAAMAGTTVVMAALRWLDLRTLAAKPMPPEIDPALAGQRARQRLAVALARRLPAGAEAVTRLQRQRARLRVRGSSAAVPLRRLDRAATTLTGVLGRMAGPADPAMREAIAAERALREIAHRIVEVERAVGAAPPAARAPLQEAHRRLAWQLDEGISAYEGLVTAAAEYLAEDGHALGNHPATMRLTESADLLRAVAGGLAELRGEGAVPGFPPAARAPRPGGPSGSGGAGQGPGGADGSGWHDGHQKVTRSP